LLLQAVKRAVVIVAGGQGHRMGGEIPKQYQELEGKPIVVHTLEQFYRFDPLLDVVVVLAQEHRNLWDAMATHNIIISRVRLAIGGATRFHSVQNGIQLIRDGVVVGIHDAVRPFVSLETLDRCYSTAYKSGSAIPVIDMDESVRMVKENNSSVHMDRSALKRVQTPQVFRSALIREAYKSTEDHSFTDDASVFESHFEKVILVEGNRQNIKITTPTDMQLASLFNRSVE
jgi:2-C-methyl-D-erythritol 4-phosphate cytidylyltransferase